MAMDMARDELQTNVRIISYSGEPFRDRAQAGQLLAEELSGLWGKNSVVLGIPRGGIIVARELARHLDADLDVVLSRKLGTPGQEELAMGSLAEDGKVFLNEEVVGMLRIPDRFVQQEKDRQMQEIRRRLQLFRTALPKTPLNNRIVIVTDDGVATGATMQAAIWAVRHEAPQRLIVAVPVAAQEALDRLSPDVDEIICLRRPYYFYAVGQFYRDFEQVTDQEVQRVLEEEAGRRKNKGQGKSEGSSQ